MWAIEAFMKLHNSIHLFCFFIITLISHCLPAQTEVNIDTNYHVNGNKLATIHRRSFKPVLYDMLNIPGIITEFPGKFIPHKVYFPKEFQLGYDSVYQKDVTHPDYYLAEVWTYQDIRGTAMHKLFYPDGKPKLISYYEGQVADTIIRVDSLGAWDNLQDSRSILPKNEWEMDTILYYSPINVGTQKGWHENGQLAFLNQFQHGLFVDTAKSWYENGQLASIYVYNDSGELHGVHREWYENGIKKLQKTYQNGGLEGQRLEWYQNGQLGSESTYHNILGGGSYLYGPATLWYEDGSLKQVEYYEHNELKGIQKYYHPNGQLRNTKNFESLPEFASKDEMLRFLKSKSRKVGEKVYKQSHEGHITMLSNVNWDSYQQGNSKYWDTNGKLILAESYELGFLVKSKAYGSKEAVELVRYPLEERRCVIKVFLHFPEESQRLSKAFCVGALAYESPDTFNVAAKMPGSDDSGIFTEVLSYDNKKNSYTYECYYPNGLPQMKLGFRDNLTPKIKDEKIYGEGSISRHAQLTGKNTYWYPNGNKKWEREYLDASFTEIEVIQHEKSWYENGQPKSERQYTAGMIDGILSVQKNGTDKVWYESGQIQRDTHYYLGKKQGKEKFWNASGVLIQDLNFMEDLPHGWQYYYNNEGSLIKKEYYLKGNLREIKEGE